MCSERLVNKTATLKPEKITIEQKNVLYVWNGKSKTN
jgi:hypothetical protein